jgi:hypothetical protein
MSRFKTSGEMDDSMDAKRKFYKKHPDRVGFAAKARLLQNTYLIENELQGKGWTLHDLEYARSTGKNFLTKKIFELVKKVLNRDEKGKEVLNQDEKGRVIIESRIWKNLLSSQPLAFNLFGELADNLGLTTRVFQDLFPDRKVKNIREIKFEHSPGRNNPKYTGDKSAFDVFIQYKDESKEDCFFGIEVKYSEALNDVPSKGNARYEEVAKEAGIFKPETIQVLKERPLQQIWRDHLLALSMFKSNNDYKRGDFIYLFPSGNVKCWQAIEKYQATFKPGQETFFRTLTLEAMVAAIKKYSAKNWIRDFEERYLNFDRI